MIFMQLKESNFDETISKKGKVIVNFTANWCPDCNLVSSTYKGLAERFKEEAVFCVVNVDEEFALEEKNKIEKIPTFIFYQDGKEVKRFHEPSIRELRERIESFAE